MSLCPDPDAAALRAVAKARAKVRDDFAASEPEPCAGAKPAWAKRATRSSAGFGPELTKPGRETRSRAYERWDLRLKGIRV